MQSFKTERAKNDKNRHNCSPNSVKVTYLTVLNVCSVLSRTLVEFYQGIRSLQGELTSKRSQRKSIFL